MNRRSPSLGRAVSLTALLTALAAGCSGPAPEGGAPAPDGVPAAGQTPMSGTTAAETGRPPAEASKAAAKATASAVAAAATPDVSADATARVGLERAAATGTAVGAVRATEAAALAPAFAAAMDAAAGEARQLVETAGGLPLGEQRGDVEGGLGEVAALLGTLGKATPADALLQLKQAVAIFDAVVAALHEVYRSAAADADKQSIGDFIASIELARARVAGTMYTLTNVP